MHEQFKTVYEPWDGRTSLKCTFTRCVDERFTNLWLEVVQIASTITLNEEENAFIW